MPGGRTGQPGSRCARGTNTLRAAGLAAGALRGRERSTTFSLWTLGLADGRGLSPLLSTSGLADGVGLLDLAEEVEDPWPSSEVGDFWPSSPSELAPPPPLSSVGDALMSTTRSFLKPGGHTRSFLKPRGLGFGGGGMSVRAFVLGMSSTGLAGFDLAGGGAHFAVATRQGTLRRGPSAAAVAACLAPTALASPDFTINTPVPAAAAIGLPCCCASSASESSVSEGAGGGACGSQEPPNFANPGALAEAATAACADGDGFGIEPPLRLDPRGGRATACLSRARGGRRGRHEGQMARGQEGKGTPTIAMTV